MKQILLFFFFFIAILPLCSHGAICTVKTSDFSGRIDQAYSSVAFTCLDAVQVLIDAPVTATSQSTITVNGWGSKSLKIIGNSTFPVAIRSTWFSSFANLLLEGVTVVGGEGIFISDVQNMLFDSCSFINIGQIQNYEVLNPTPSNYQNHTWLIRRSIFDRTLLNALVRSARIQVEDSMFRDKTGGWYGGAIYGLSSLNLKANIFVNNSAYGGGAVYCGNGCAISNCTFMGNNGVTVGNLYPPYGYGGAIYSTGTAFLSNNYYKDNTAMKGKPDIAVNGTIFLDNNGDNTGYHIFLGGSLISANRTLNLSLISCTNGYYPRYDFSSYYGHIYTCANGSLPTSPPNVTFPTQAPNPSNATFPSTTNGSLPTFPPNVTFPTQAPNPSNSSNSCISSSDCSWFEGTCLYGANYIGYCSCYSGRSGGKCQYPAPYYFRPTNVSSTLHEFIPRMTFEVGREDVLIKAVLPSSPSVYTNPRSYGNITTIRFQSSSYQSDCDYPNSPDWLLDSSTMVGYNSVDSYYLNVKFNKLIGCGFSPSDETDNYKFYNATVTVSRTFETLNPLGSYDTREVSYSFVLSLMFPKHISVSTDIEYSDSATVQFTGVSKIEYVVSTNKWQFELTALTQSPFQLENTYSPINTYNSRVDVYSMQVSQCTLQNSVCQQKISFTANGCSALQMMIQPFLYVTCRNQSCNEVPILIAPQFTIQTGDSCPIQSVSNLSNISMSSFGDAQLTSPQTSFSLSQSAYFLVTMSSPSQILLVSIDRVCITTGQSLNESCNSQNSVSFLPNNNNNTSSQGTYARSSFSILVSDVRSKWGILGSNTTQVGVRAELSVVYGNTLGKRSTIKTSAISTFISVSEDNRNDNQLSGGSLLTPLAAILLMTFCLLV